jgi:hypothetical protein
MENLAARITENVQERGAIVLFTPVSGKLSVESLVGDLACHFAQLGDRVLVFDARTGRPGIPSWVGPNASHVHERVGSFLEGTTDRAGGCFASTLITSVDYSRADLLKQLNGVIATYRFRRMAQDMRERYSLVLMIAPDLESAGGADDFLSTISEGVVVVLGEKTNPAELEGYIDNLRGAEHTLYGAVTMSS